MRDAIKSTLDAFGLRLPVRRLVQAVRANPAVRRLCRIDARLIETYRREHSVRKLHVGCGDSLLPGWLNAGLPPWAPAILRLDATEVFPFPDQEFDFIFSEHMIEHISLAQGRAMLAECHRTMKPGGRIRISTPDLRFLLELHQPSTDRQRAYIEWAGRTFLGGAGQATATVVINNFVRDWGHQFIYDEETLRSAMEGAGFGRIRLCCLGESEEPALRGLENTARMPAGFLELETLTLEGTREATGAR